MVLSYPFHCRTKVIEDTPFAEALSKILDGRSWALVSTKLRGREGILDGLYAKCGTPKVVINRVNPNPKALEVIELAGEVKDVEVVVGLGGGSAIDAAKAMVALNGLDFDEDILFAHLREGTALPEGDDYLPLISIPTTSGTGAEITCWGTIWGDDGIKFSVNDERLYPSHAILDPVLCLTMPREITLATGLDALSHAVESIWNKRHSQLVDTLAVQAIGLVKSNLETALNDPSNLGARGNMQIAALLAGIAMGTTQTALAHSISYPFTSRLGLSHGLACSFTLPEIARFNAAVAPQRIDTIGAAMGCTGDKLADVMEEWFTALNVGEYILNYVPDKFLETMEGDLITRARAANNIRDVDAAAAGEITQRALDFYRHGKA